MKDLLRISPDIQEAMAKCLDDIPQMVSYADARLVYCYVNKSYEQFFGIKREKIIGRTVKEVIGDAALSGSMQHIRRVLLGKKVEYLEMLEFKEDRLKLISGRLIPDWEKGGQSVKGYTAILTDISHIISIPAFGLHLFERAVKESIWFTTLDLRLIYVSAYTEKIFGYSVAERMAMGIERFFPEAVRQKVEKRIKHRLKEVRAGNADSFQTFSMEMQARHKQGHVIDIETSIGFIRNQADEPIGILGVTRDITERMRAVRALKESEQKLNLFFHHSADGYLLTDEEGRITDWNNTLEKLSGLQAKEVIGRYIWELNALGMFEFTATQEQMILIKKQFQLMLKEGVNPYADKPVEYKGMIKEKEIYVQQEAFPIKTEMGYRLGGITRDVTRSRQLLDTIQKQKQIMEQSEQISSMGSFEWHIPENEYRVSEGFRNIHQFYAEEVDFDALIRIIHPRDRDKLKAKLRRILDAEGKYDSTLARFRIIRCLDKKHRLTETLVRPVPDPKSGKIHSIIGTVVDVTEREKLSESRRRLASDALLMNQKFLMIRNLEQEMEQLADKYRFSSEERRGIRDRFKAFSLADKDWKEVSGLYEEVFEDLYEALLNRYPGLSPTDLRHCAYIRMNFTTKEIANLMQVKPTSVQMARVRLKKKLKLSGNEDLRAFILAV